MCLVINRAIHENISPFVAKNNIYTVKTLSKTNLPNKYRTPYFFEPVIFESSSKHIKFAHLNSEIKVKKLSILCFNTFIKKYCVNEGIHSNVTEKCTFDELNDHLTVFRGEEVFISIIPSGSNYFVGEHGDIVSDHLLIFYDLDDVKKYLNLKCENAVSVSEDVASQSVNL